MSSAPSTPRVPSGWVPKDPFTTDSILGATYGMKKGPVEKKAPPSTSTPGRIHPNAYEADTHPAHAARAKWAEDYESGKISPVQPRNGFRPLPYYPQAAYSFVTPPQSTGSEGYLMIPSGPISKLSPFAAPFVPAPRRRF